MIHPLQSRSYFPEGCGNLRIGCFGRLRDLMAKVSQAIVRCFQNFRAIFRIPPRAIPVATPAPILPPPPAPPALAPEAPNPIPAAALIPPAYVAPAPPPAYREPEPPGPPPLYGIRPLPAVPPPPLYGIYSHQYDSFNIWNHPEVVQKRIPCDGEIERFSEFSLAYALVTRPNDFLEEASGRNQIERALIEGASQKQRFKQDRNILLSYYRANLNELVAHFSGLQAAPQNPFQLIRDRENGIFEEQFHQVIHAARTNGNVAAAVYIRNHYLKPNSFMIGVDLRQPYPIFYYYHATTRKGGDGSFIHVFHGLDKLSIHAGSCHRPSPIDADDNIWQSALLTG